MKTLNEWMTLIANIGVVLGIFFVGIEIRQNSKTIEAQIYQSRTDSVMDMNLLAIDSNNFTSVLAKLDAGLDPDTHILDTAGYSEEDITRLRRYLVWRRQFLDNQHYQYSLGLLDESHYQGVVLPGIRYYAPLWKQFDALARVRPDFGELVISELEKLE